MARLASWRLAGPLFLFAMILLTTAREIARLLKEGNLSYRRIARRVGVSRMTVSNIATGKRGVHGSSGQTDRSE